MKYSRLSKQVFASVIIILLSFGCNKKEEGKLTVTTKPVTEITTESAKCGGNVSSTGNFSVGNCGICWNTAPSPTIDYFFTTDNQGVGEFISIMSHLSPDTKYYVRAYATTSSGIMYGEELDFTTEALPVAAFTVYTNDVTEITASTAKCGGVVTANGDVNITARGVCWSTLPQPSLTHHSLDGQGLGSFSSNVTGLDENTSYNIWAYATTSDGITTYGDLKTFTTETASTLVELPTVTIDNVTEITGTSAKCGGTVTADGAADVTDRGICWSTTQQPMVYHSHVSVGNGTGPFIAEMTGLENGTTYYVRAYATNSEGTNYSSDERAFTTLAPPIVITASPITNITQNSATVGGNVTDDGGEAPVRGICWGQAPNPTTNDNPIFSGSGLGEYTVQITGLLPGTTYHVRAFAKNSVATSYGQDVTFTTEQSSVTLNDFLGLYSVSAYNRDTQQNETWTGTNITTFNNPNTNTTWVKVEGLFEGSGHEYFTALGEFSEEHHCIRLYSGWAFTDDDYYFYFLSDPSVLYIARFYPIYQTTGSNWYYLTNGAGYENSGEAWLTMNSDGTISLGSSDFPDEDGRFANGFVFVYYNVDDNSYGGRFDRYTNVILTNTSKTPTNNSEPFIMIENVKYDTKNHLKQNGPMKATATQSVRKQ